MTSLGKFVQHHVATVSAVS